MWLAAFAVESVVTIGEPTSAAEGPTAVGELPVVVEECRSALAHS